MNNVTIKMFDISHLDEVLVISNLSFNIPWSRESFLKELENNFSRYVVAICDDHVVGFGGMWLILDEGHITNIAVHPEYRKNKIGSVILSALFDICKREDATSLTLEVRESNIAAQKLYEKFGFVKEGLRKKYYHDNGENAILMWNRNILKGTSSLS